MKVPLLIVAIVCLVPTLTMAESGQEYRRCERRLLATADNFLRVADKSEQSHQKRYDKYVARFFEKYRGTDSDALAVRQSIARIEKQRNIPAFRNANIDGVAATLRTFVNLDDEYFECPDRGQLAYRLENYLRNYNLQQDLLLQEVRDRLDIENLTEDEGLAIIAFYSYDIADTVDINRLGAITGDVRFGPVHNGEYFRIIRVKAGEYRWEKIRREMWVFKYIYDLKHRDMRFSVEAGKLNYTGVFVFDPTGNYSANSLTDRVSIVIAMLQQRYPELSERYELENGLVEDDQFLRYYLAEKARHEVAQGND